MAFFSRLIMHVGPHKTATTTFQHFLFDQRKQLSEKGICYPVIRRFHPNKINHNDLATSMVAGNIAKTESYLKIIAMQAKNYDNIILSAEEFSNCLNNKLEEGLKQITDRLGRPEYVFVDRDPISRLTSALTHTIAENLDSVVAYGNVSVYLKESLQFVKMQREFYEQRSAEFLSFDEFVSGGAGNIFLDRFLGVKLNAAVTKKNQSDHYTKKILAFSPIDAERVAKFFGDCKIGSLIGQDASAGVEVTRAIRDAVETCLSVCLKKE